MKKLLIICGPTATGKTSLGIKLAKKFNGQIISADSRQVYKGMDITTGKDKPKNKSIIISGYDLVRPDQDFSVAHFVKFAQNKINQIYKSKKIPIIIGGTGLYIKSLISPPQSLNIPPNQSLRQKLEKLSLKLLQNRLKKFSPSRFKSMNHSDLRNPRRLIRAIEISNSHKLNQSSPRKLLQTKSLWIGLNAPLKVLDQRINQKILNRINQGMTQEVKKLAKKYKDKKLPTASSLGFNQWRNFLNGKISKQEAINKWQTSEHQYARRQLTWFKKQKQIHWFDISKPNFVSQVVYFIKNWYA